jgi:hypothetical protein
VEDSVPRTVAHRAYVMTPSLSVHRGSPEVGFVGASLDNSPFRLHGGRSLQTPPLKSRAADRPVDWWADLVEAEFGVRSDSLPDEATQPPRMCGVDVMTSDSLEECQHSASLQPADSQTPMADRVLVELEAVVRLLMRSPLIEAAPKLRRARKPVSVHSLRRSGRIAASSRAQNTTLQARRVLLKKLGIAVEENACRSTSKRRYRNSSPGDWIPRPWN